MMRVLVGAALLLCSVLPAFNEPVHVRGRIVDAQTGTPLPMASVAVVDHTRTRLLHGIIASRTGMFDVSTDSLQLRHVRITFTGYDTLVVDLAQHRPVDNAIDLGDVALRPSQALQAEVSVTAERDQITLAPGKKVFNVDKSLTTAGGTALDVLRQVPSVSVDANGAVTVRGSAGVNILVDGKPITAYGDPSTVLKNIPAASMQTVEVITNPGSKYDAEGQSGILNITLRKQRQSGVNAASTLTMGLYDNYTGQLNGNYRDESVNYSASADLTSTRGRRYKRSVSSFDNGLSVYRDGPSYATNKTASGKLATEFTFDAHHRASATADISYSTGASADPFYSTITSAPGVVTTSSLDQQSTSMFLSGGLTLDYGYTGETPATKLTAMLIAFPSSFDVTSLAQNSSPAYGRRVQTTGTSSFINAQADYSTLLPDSSTVEAGAKAVLQTIHSDFTYAAQDVTTGAYIRDPILSNGAYHLNDVLAAYATYGRSFGPLSLQLGLRGEYTIYAYDGTNADSLDFARSYGNLFPNIAVSYQLSEEGSVNGSYSRRINRPDDPQLNPFLDRSDSLTWRTGNPALLPEFTNSFELGYLHALPTAVINAELFYRHTTDHINLRFRQQVGPATILERPYNFGYADAYGASMFANLEPADWLKIYAELSYYGQDVVGDIFDQHFESYGHGWNAKASATAVLPWDVRGQFNLDYTAPQAIPQGYRYAFTYMSLGVNKEFMDRALTVGLQWIDPFNTARFGGVVYGQGFNAELLNQRDYPLVTLSVSYRINNARTQQQRATPGGALVGGSSSKI